MTAPRLAKIALLPLDDRPVNVLLPEDVARIAGVTLDVPPVTHLPDYRSPADTDALAAWLLDRTSDPAVGHLVVSIDMLCFGGLIASRISHDPLRVVLERLDVLRRIRAERPDLKISAVSLVMRASDSYSPAEEPGYWAEYGRELHRLGADIHESDGRSEVDAVTALTDVPTEIVADFATRRIRNHVLNLEALALLEEGTLDFLAITADDTAVLSSGSAEQAWLRHWMRLLPEGHKVLMYPGADEVGAVLVARAIAEHAGTTPAIRISCPDADALGRVPAFENVPLSESIRRQVIAAGARLVEAEEDAVLVVHGPGATRGDILDAVPPPDEAEGIDRVIRALQDELDAGHTVALADVRYTNGCDPELGRRLKESGLLGRLAGFGGWNTAANTIGGIVATVVATTIGRAIGTLDPPAVQQALLTRILDDLVFQSFLRREVGVQFFPDHLPLADDAKVAEAERAIQKGFDRALTTDLPFDNWVVSSVRLPWKRSFEVGIGLRARA